MLIASSPGLERKILQFSDRNVKKFPLLSMSFSIDSMRTLCRAFHCYGGFTSTPICHFWCSSSASSGGGSEGGPGHVVLCCNDVPSDGGGALFLRHSSTTFIGVLLGTDWKGAATTLAFVLLCCSSNFELAPHPEFTNNNRTSTDRTEGSMLTVIPKDSFLFQTFLKNPSHQLPLSTFTLPLLWLPRSCLFALSQLLGYVSSCMALSYLIESHTSLGSRFSVFQHCLFGDAPQTSCAMKPSTLNSSLSLLHSIPVTFFFSPSAFHPFAFLSHTLLSSSLTMIFNIFPYSCVSFFSGLERFVSFGP